MVNRGAVRGGTRDSDTVTDSDPWRGSLKRKVAVAKRRTPVSTTKSTTELLGKRDALIEHLSLPLDEELLRSGWSDASLAATRETFERLRHHLVEDGRLPPVRKRPVHTLRALDMWGVVGDDELTRHIGRFEMEIRPPLAYYDRKRRWDPVTQRFWWMVRRHHRRR